MITVYVIDSFPVYTAAFKVILNKCVKSESFMIIKMSWNDFINENLSLDNTFYIINACNLPYSDFYFNSSILHLAKRAIIFAEKLTPFLFHLLEKKCFSMFLLKDKHTDIIDVFRQTLAGKVVFSKATLNDIQLYNDSPSNSEF